MASYLSLDVGEKRIGVAIADVSAPFPAPLVTLEASDSLVTEFAELLKKHKVETLVIGYPRNQKGEPTAQTERVEYIASLLQIPKNISVYWQDESLTSVKAEAELSKRKKHFTKKEVDSLAATYILEDFLQSTERIPRAESEPMEASVDGVLPSDDTKIENQDAEPTTQKTKHSFKKSLATVAAILGAAILVGLILAIGWYKTSITPRTKDGEYAVLSVKNGTGTSQIARDLEEQKIIKSATAFVLYVRLHRITNLQAGDYRLSSAQSVQEIAKILSKGRVTNVNVLISPGLRLDQIEAKLIQAGYIKTDLDAALEKIRSHPLLKDLPAGTKLEGYLFPDTYQVGPDTSAEQLLRLMLDNFQKKLSPEILSGIAAQKLTLNQAVILASIIQKEASKPSVQPTIAQVFIKRYTEGISLGSDVTALYGAYNDGIVLPEQSAQAGAIAVNHDSAYNTRKRIGLPPTAISNFNLTALQAVAQPSNTDYLYFVAGDDGQIYFSKTAAEHDALVQQHCKDNC